MDMFAIIVKMVFQRSMYGYEILQNGTLRLCSKFLHNCDEIEHTKS